MTRTTLLIKVPRDNESGPMVAEQIFASIHSLVEDSGIWKELFGFRQERVSFEIANTGGSINFFVNINSKYRNFIEVQIYAQYPLAEICVCDDYVKHEGEEIYGVDLMLDNSDMYPVKRYPQFEEKKWKYPVDSLAALTSAFSKLNVKGDQLWLQIVVSPLEEKWRSVMAKCIKILIQRYKSRTTLFKRLYSNVFCKRSRMLRMLFFPVYGVLWFQGLFVDDGGLELRDFKEQLSVTHDKEAPLNGALDKSGRLLFEVNIRAVYLSKNRDSLAAEAKFREVVGSFKQFSLPQMNCFRSRRISRGWDLFKVYLNRLMLRPFVLNIEELATIYHLPSITVDTPNIHWVKSRKMAPPENLPFVVSNVESEGLKILGRTNFRDQGDLFGILNDDSRRHVYIIGKTGMGKSTLLENMIYSDLVKGNGLAVVDPHGDLAVKIMDFIPSSRLNDVMVFDPADKDFPIAFNMMENFNPEMNGIICSGIIGVFKKIYSESWGPRLEYILRNTIMSLLEYGNVTFLAIIRLLQDQNFRKVVVGKLQNPVLKSFWVDEFEKMDQRLRIEAISPIMNKVGQFLSIPVVRNILGQVRSSVDLRYIMDKKKIAVFNLSKGRLGEDVSSLLGSLIVTKFQLDAMSRANIVESERKDFYLYVDEFQNFATESFATILSEARKYRLNLIIANQYVAQIPESVRDAVFGNVGTIISFQVGYTDAEYLSGVFGEEITEKDLMYLSKYSAYVKLLIKGMPSQTFSMNTLGPVKINGGGGISEKVIKMSRERYSTKKSDVERKILKWSLNTNLN